MRRCPTASNAKFSGKSAAMVNELQMWRDGEATACLRRSLSSVHWRDVRSTLLPNRVPALSHRYEAHDDGDIRSWPGGELSIPTRKEPANQSFGAIEALANGSAEPVSTDAEVPLLRSNNIRRSK
jgi:hypothetical protein